MTREEAIKAIKAWDFLDNDEKEAIETLIPELKESEDEKIRKAIIGHIKGLRFYDSYYDVTPDEMIAWLENQGKPKWSEEDSSMQLTLIRDIELVSFISKEGKDERIMWLNKLDDRFH